MWLIIIVILLIIRLLAMQVLVNQKSKLVLEVESKVKTLEYGLEIEQMYCEELQIHVDYYKLGMEETIKENIALKKTMSKL